MRKALTFLMAVAVFGFVIIPVAASAWEDAEILNESGQLQDTTGKYDQWFENGRTVIQIICPHPDADIDCAMWVPDQYCEIPGMPGYSSCDVDYYYFQAEEYKGSHINNDGGEETMLVPRDWLESVWPPPGCE
jgi:hypothetical protein